MLGPTHVSELSTAIGVLSAMITPAILILASGSILATTSARLIRAHDRIRAGAEDIQNLNSNDPVVVERRKLQYELLGLTTRRARLLQLSMTLLYLAIGAFILTSIVIGLLSLTGYDVAWVSLIFGFIGSVLLLATSALLINESRLAMKSTRAETEFVIRWGAHHMGMKPFIAPES